MSSTLAKWLVPSVTGLFVAIGYVVQSAHQDLLGVEFGGIGSSDYLASAAGFFRDLLTITSDVAQGGVSLAEQWLGLCVTFLIVAVALALSWTIRDARWSKRFGLQLLGCLLDKQTGKPARSGAVALGTLLLMLVGAKFLFFDASLTKLDSVVVGVGTTPGDPGRAATIDERLKAAADRGGLQGRIAKRALRTWTNMVCSRMSKDALDRVRNEYDYFEVRCGFDEQTSNARVTGEFIAQSLATVLLIILASHLLRIAKTSVLPALALLALAYTLMWPYAYGKLIKSTFFEYGLVLLKSPPSEEAPALGAKKGEPTPGRTEHAIVLSRNGGGATLLVVKAGECANGQQVKLWAVPNSEIVVIREIYREDVITWKTLNERPCPSALSPLEQGVGRKGGLR